MRYKLTTILLTAAALSTAGILYSTRASASSYGDSGPQAVFSQTSFFGTQRVDEDQVLQLGVSISGPLLSAVGTPTRYLASFQEFESNGMVLTRVCAHSELDPLGAEAVSSTYSVGQSVENNEPLPVYEVRISPASGKAWKDVSEFEDLSLQVTRVR